MSELQKFLSRHAVPFSLNLEYNSSRDIDVTPPASFLATGGDVEVIGVEKSLVESPVDIRATAVAKSTPVEVSTSWTSSGVIPMQAQSQVPMGRGVASMEGAGKIMVPPMDVGVYSGRGLSSMGFGGQPAMDLRLSPLDLAVSKHPEVPVEATPAAAIPRRPKIVKRYSNPTPSNYCHVCCRARKRGPHMICSQVSTGYCRKMICDKCFQAYGWNWDEAVNDPHWLCPHCSDSCPPRAQCKVYGRNSERPSERRRQEDYSSHRVVQDECRLTQLWR